MSTYYVIKKNIGISDSETTKAPMFITKKKVHGIEFFFSKCSRYPF